MKRFALFAVFAALCGAFLLSSPHIVTSQTAAPTAVAGTNDYKIVGYFTQWGMYARQYRVKQIVTSGSAAKLTHINYAFANVSPDYTCYEEDRYGWGDETADYLSSYAADQSVDGLPDDPSQHLKGHFNQLKKLKAMYPNLKVLVSIGGWSWSGRFSGAAQPEHRAAFVKSCIDLLIKGNLPIWAYTPGSTPIPSPENHWAQGVFDGIDLDWEYPASEAFPGDPARNIPTNVYSPDDTQNYTALLAEFRRQLDELGAAEGKHYLLTVALPMGKSLYSKIELDKIHPYLDFMNIMGYDAHGNWDTTTNFQAPLYQSPDDPTPVDKQASIDSAVTDFLKMGIPPNKIVVGVPFYGRGWTGVANANNGLYQSGLSGAAIQPAPATFDAGIEDYKKLKLLNYPSFRDPKSKAFWIFDGTTFWSYDDPQAINDKMTYIKAKGLGGAMFWSLDGDDGTLVDAVYKGLKQP
jgi:chitinase